MNIPKRKYDSTPLQSLLQHHHKTTLVADLIIVASISFFKKLVSILPFHISISGCKLTIFTFTRHRPGERPGDNWILFPAEDCVRGDGRCGQLILRHTLRRRWSCNTDPETETKGSGPEQHSHHSGKDHQMLDEKHTLMKGAQVCCLSEQCYFSFLGKCHTETDTHVQCYHLCQKDQIKDCSWLISATKA